MPQLAWATQRFPAAAGNAVPGPSNLRQSASDQASKQLQMSSSGPSASNQVNQTPSMKEQLARAAELRDILNNLEQVNNAERRISLLDQLCSTEDVLNLPEYPNPPSVETGELTINLLRHQVSSIVYMCNLV